MNTSHIEAYKYKIKQFENDCFQLTIRNPFRTIPYYKIKDIQAFCDDNKYHISTIYKTNKYLHFLIITSTS